ncbi:MAG: outer membrane protein assembly factor BamE [Bdellovibrionales bacterium]|nr:outer membrane protein assembly factor BamE [Bdellovibrionales bacterium]
MRLLLPTLTFLLITGCASIPQRDLENLRPGMDKDMVLNKVGNPKRTFRANGQDHWIYVYFENDIQMSRQLDFADGKLLKVGLPISKQSLERALENAESMEEFESKAREHQRKNSNFKDVDGG